MSTQTLDRETTVRRAPRAVIVSAWAVPIMVVGQFAMLAIVPVALVLIGTLRDMHPVFAAIIVAVGVAFAVSFHVLRRKRAHR
ncbi:hypothetical protein DMC64_21320 [Amycolatopsis sp. WAC 04197]|uniref:hypothetical protein n=1 Tax=Amycolatopsis TaxID=1813 RepID=UPI000F783B1B|nr:hypothetical protein [Amycolatopsis sp. WAC 04197]RSN44048.1 hypothetical protein DMC64_21320 [Amycolatopsis sp. WAC 04197]